MLPVQTQEPAEDYCGTQKPANRCAGGRADGTHRAAYGGEERWQVRAEVADGDAAERQRGRALHVLAGCVALQRSCRGVPPLSLSNCINFCMLHLFTSTAAI